MSKYEKVEKLDNATFKRLVGVEKETFAKMVEVAKEYEENRKKELGIGGRKQSLCIEDKILLMLEYYREYRTLAHIGLDYGVSEATAWRVVRNVEEILIKSGNFSLSGKKVLKDKNDVEIAYVVIDVTESPIQRPKKTKKVLFRKEKETYNQISNHNRPR